jgi:hypothetical protein
MSSVLTPCLVDLEEIRRAVGSGDESLIEAIRAHYPDKFGRSDADDDSGEIPLDQALRQVVTGEGPFADSPVMYLRAFELICSHLGEVILPDMWGGVSWRALTDTGLEEVMMTGPPVALPSSGYESWVGYLSAEDIAAKVAALGDSHLTDDDEDLQELLGEYEGWLREAADRGKSIVFFIC